MAAIISDAGESWPVYTSDTSAIHYTSAEVEYQTGTRIEEENSGAPISRRDPKRLQLSRIDVTPRRLPSRLDDAF
jgi:hypothetical protein